MLNRNAIMAVCTYGRPYVHTAAVSFSVRCGHVELKRKNELKRKKTTYGPSV